MNDLDFLESVFSAIDTPVRFARRPDPVPADLRLSWRLAVLAMILRRCRADTATVQQLHVLSWAIKSTRSRAVFLRWANGEKRPDDVIVRFEPSLSLSIDLASGSGLVTRSSNGRIKLTEKGLLLAEAANKNPNMLSFEKEFLNELPRRVTQRFVSDAVAWAG